MYIDIEGMASDSFVGELKFVTLVNEEPVWMVVKGNPNLMIMHEVCGNIKGKMTCHFSVQQKLSDKNFSCQKTCQISEAVL